MSATRVGIVGAGPMGRLHARTVAKRARAHGDCELAAIVDRHPGRAKRLTQEFGGVASSELESLEGVVDAAIVCVPTSAHHEVASLLIPREIDVFVEKPIACTVMEGEDLARLARLHGRILQVGHVEWFNPGWREAVGSAGTPRSIVVDRLNRPSHRGLEMDVVEDLMIHDLDWVTRWLGEEIVDLEAEGRCVVNDKLDEAEARIRFRSGCRVTLRANRVHRERSRCVRVEGSAGSTTADLSIPAAGTVSATGTARPDPLEIQWKGFLESLRLREQPEANAEVGIAALRLVERVRGSIGEAGRRSLREDDPDLRR